MHSLMFKSDCAKKNKCWKKFLCKLHIQLTIAAGVDGILQLTTAFTNIIFIINQNDNFKVYTDLKFYKQTINTHNHIA